MNLYRREQSQKKGESVASYAPIAQALNSLPVDERKSKFLYFVATEQLAYQKYPRIYKLEARHGVTWVAPTCIKMQVKIFSFTILQNHKSSFRYFQS